MSTTPPDDSPRPEPNPYEPPRAGSGAGRSIGRGLGAVAKVVLIGLACLIAFVVTCFPTGMVSESLTLAVVVGLVAAGLVGLGLAQIGRGGTR